MSRTQLALVLWAVCALAAGSVVFDWQTRLAGFEFISAQHARRAQGLPLATIEEGFRPLVGAAARRASMWLLLILAIGTSSIAFAARRAAVSERERLRSRESKG